MKTISVDVSEPVYQDFQKFAETTDRNIAELIREAMDLHRQQRVVRRTSLRDRRPLSVGGPIQPITRGEVFGEMIDHPRS